MDMNKGIILKAQKTIFLVVIGILIGTTMTHLLLYTYDASGWVVNSNADNLKDLPPFEKMVLGDLIAQKTLFSVSDLLGNFTSYYHFLITMLVTIVVLLASFLTLNLYKSREEHDAYLKNRLNRLFKDFERDLGTTGAEKHLDEYEELHTYIERKITEIVRNSDELQDYKYEINEICTDILNNIVVRATDDAFFENICHRLKCEDGKALVVKKTEENRC